VLLTPRYKSSFNFLPLVLLCKVSFAVVWRGSTPVDLPHPFLRDIHHPTPFCRSSTIQSKAARGLAFLLFRQTSYNPFFRFYFLIFFPRSYEGPRCPIWSPYSAAPIRLTRREICCLPIPGNRFFLSGSPFLCIEILRCGICVDLVF